MAPPYVVKILSLDSMVTLTDKPMWGHSPSFVTEPLWGVSGGITLLVGPQGALARNCHIWPVKSNVGFAATIFSYQGMQTNLSRWEGLAINR